MNTTSSEPEGLAGRTNAQVTHITTSIEDPSKNAILNKLTECIKQDPIDLHVLGDFLLDFNGYMQSQSGNDPQSAATRESFYEEVKRVFDEAVKIRVSQGQNQFDHETHSKKYGLYDYSNWYGLQCLAVASIVGNQFGYVYDLRVSSPEQYGGHNKHEQGYKERFIQEMSKYLDNGDSAHALRELGTHLYVLQDWYNRGLVKLLKGR